MKSHFHGSLVLLGIACSAALSAGCGGGGYCVDYANTMCRNVLACCTSAKRQSLLGNQNVNDEGKCKTDMQLLCEGLFAQQLYAVKQGTATYSAEKANACFQAMDRGANQCTGYLATSPYAELCKDSPFVGTVAVGGTCHWGFECGPAAYCSAEKCVAFGKEGDACATAPCNKGLSCTGGKCTAPKAAGADCTSSSECADKLFCDSQCKALLGAGAPCTSDSACSSGQCLPGTCANGSSCLTASSCYSQGTCQRDSTKSCSTDYSCGQVCSTSGTSCTSSATCPAGETCGNDKCLPPTCGGRVCASAGLVQVNYCPL